LPIADFHGLRNGLAYEMSCKLMEELAQHI